jgi:hypothetical protein
MSTSAAEFSTLYLVTRETIDYHNDPSGGLHGTEKIGTFSSLEEANEVARTNLHKEWDKDYFESYEVKEEDGFVTVTAGCPEGEEMIVRVEEVRKKISSGPKYSKSKVYTVTRQIIDHRHDRDGSFYCNDIAGAFSSRREANEAALTNLLNQWGRDFFSYYDVQKMGGLVSVTALCPDGKEMRVTVEEHQLQEGPDEESQEESSQEESSEDSDEESSSECSDDDDDEEY